MMSSNSIPMWHRCTTLRAIFTQTLNYLCVNFLMSRPLDARCGDSAETSNAALFYVNRMTDKRMKVSPRMAFAMSRFSNVKAL